MDSLPLEILCIVVRYLENADFYSLAVTKPRELSGILSQDEFMKRFMESGPLTSKKIRHLINYNKHPTIKKLAIEKKIRFHHGDVYAAVEKGHLEIIQLIETYKLGTFDNMHLTCAIKSGYFEVTRYMCNILQPRQNALFFACKFGHQLIVEYLCNKHGLEPDDSSYIEAAILNGHLMTARYLMTRYSHKAPVTTFNKTIRSRDLLMLKFLHQECRIGPDQRSMHIVICNQDILILDYLFEQCNYTLSAAHLVEIFENSDQLTEYIEAKGRNIRIATDDRSINACYRDGNLRLINYLHRTHSLIPQKGEWLKVAYEENDIEKIRYLVSQIMLNT